MNKSKSIFTKTKTHYVVLKTIVTVEVTEEDGIEKISDIELIVGTVPYSIADLTRHSLHSEPLSEALLHERDLMRIIENKVGK